MTLVGVSSLSPLCLQHGKSLGCWGGLGDICEILGVQERNPVVQERDALVQTYETVAVHIVNVL